MTKDNLNEKYIQALRKIEKESWGNVDPLSKRSRSTLRGVETAHPHMMKYWKDEEHLDTEKFLNYKINLNIDLIINKLDEIEKVEDRIASLQEGTRDLGNTIKMLIYDVEIRNLWSQQLRSLLGRNTADDFAKAGIPDFIYDMVNEKSKHMESLLIDGKVLTGWEYTEPNSTHTDKSTATTTTTTHQSDWSEPSDNDASISTSTTHQSDWSETPHSNTVTTSTN